MLLFTPGPPFYEKLNALLQKAGFDAFVEELCAPFYAKNVGHRSIPPGRYLFGSFEGIDSERGIETPTTAQQIALDKRRKGEMLSNNSTF